MIVGFDGSRAFFTHKTGTENYSYQLLKALASIDHKNKYIVFLRPKAKNTSKVGLLESPMDSLPFEVDKWPDNFKFVIISWFRIWTQGGLSLQTFKDKLDVLFVPSHTLPLIRKPGLKTVVTVHDLGSEYLPSMHQVKQRLYLSLMQKYQLKTATKIIAVSKATEQDLVKRLGIDRKKITVIYEGFDKNLFRLVNNDVLVNSLKHYYLEKGKYFFFVGTVQPRKNLERVIKAFCSFTSLRGAQRRSNLKKRLPRPFGARNDEVKLVIAGSKGWLADEIYRLPKKLGIENRVEFIGYVPEKDLPSLYSGAIALVFPSLFEGFGLPILEAQACGCPVITSNVSSMPEVAGGGAILVNPYSIKQIVDAMIKVQRTAQRLQLMKNGFENIKRFSWEKCAKETLKVLEDT